MAFIKKKKPVTNTKWAVDLTHSEITFKAKHLMISYVKGSFKTFDANIYTRGKDFTTAEIDLWIEAASIDTGDSRRDEHLMGNDFFDVAEHKQIAFTSSTMGKPDHEGNCELWGDLTIVGITKNVKLNVRFGGMAKDQDGNEKAGFAVNGRINRKDWQLAWNTTLDEGGVMIGDDILISCEIELINAGQRAQVIEPEPDPTDQGDDAF